jgi:hypothetical protein
MPEASRHAKPKPIAVRLRASILAAVALAGVAVAFVVLQGGSTVPKPARYAIPMPNAAAFTSDNNQDNTAAVRHEIATLAVRFVMRTRATRAAGHRHHAAPAAARHPQQQTPQQTQPTAQPTPASTARGGGDAASSPLGVCIRKAEEGGSYAWGPGNGGGAYQFLLGTWEKYGGAASEYGVAGPAYQDQIFDNAIAAGGASNWTAYDGC